MGHGFLFRRFYGARVFISMVLWGVGFYFDGFMGQWSNKARVRRRADESMSDGLRGCFVSDPGTSLDTSSRLQKSPSRTWGQPSASVHVRLSYTYMYTYIYIYIYIEREMYTHNIIYMYSLLHVFMFGICV